jgi:hypothetical protein
MGYFLLPVAIACGVLAESAQPWFPTRRYEGRESRTFTFSANSVLLSLAGLNFTACLFVPGTRNHLLVPFRMAGLDGDPIHISNQTMNIRKPLSLERRSFGEIDIWMPRDGDQCWDAPLPCSHSVSARQLGLRRPAEGFRGGFVRIGGN